MSENQSRPPRFPTTRLWLVQVGELDSEQLIPDLTGHFDPPLSEQGRRQVAAAGQEIASSAGPAIGALYASPLTSGQQAAALLAPMLGLAGYETSPALGTVMPESLPPGPSGADALRMMQEYAWSTVEVLKELHAPDVSIVLVSHELPIRALICRALGMSLEDAWRFRLDAGSLSAVEFRGPRTILSLLNDRCHLD